MRVSFCAWQFQLFSFTVQAVDEVFFLLTPTYSYTANALTFAMAPNVWGSTVIQMIMADEDHSLLHHEGVRAFAKHHTLPAICLSPHSLKSIL
jgi:hypothetical protein